MGASRENRENQVEWDLHENAEIVPLEFTEENKIEEFGIEKSQAENLTKGLMVTLAERDLLDLEFEILSKQEVTKENIPKFRELRIKYQKNRTQGTDKWHEIQSEVPLRLKQFLDAKKRAENSVNKSREEVLMNGEKTFENQEKERKRIINEKRIEIIRPYVDDVTGLDFSEFDDENFDDYVLGKKTRYNERIEAEKQEAIRIENELLAELERKRLAEIENEKIRVENARLQKEAEAKELALQAERKLQAEKEAKLLAESNAKLKAEQDAKAKLEAELQAKKDAETKAENERLGKIEADKKAADKLLKAGQKKQIESWIETFQIEIPDHLKDDKIANDILSKFWLFKSWAKKETENL